MRCAREAGKGQKVGATIGRPPNLYQDNAKRTGASPLKRYNVKVVEQICSLPNILYMAAAHLR